MKQILFIILLYINGTIYAQENVDTLYYNRLGKIAANTLFAEYYRIALYPADSTCQKEFKDFYNSGELRKEGYFLSISSFDDSETVFDGEVRSYFRNGNISEKSHYDNGRFHGEYARYNDNGKWWHTPFIRLENYLEHVKHSTRTAPVKLLNTMRENRFTTIIYYRMAMEIH